MVEWNWNERVDGCPLTRSNKSWAQIETDAWTKDLVQRMQENPAQADGRVIAEIRLYLTESPARERGDLDNYAKTILDILRKGNGSVSILEDDRQVTTLRLHRFKAKSQSKVIIRLRWN